MQPLKFWFFVWRSLARAMSETLKFFGWDVKTIVTTLALFALGYLIYWKVKGASETKDEFTKFTLFIVVPYLVFIMVLFAVQIVRAPYLTYRDEYAKAQAKVDMAEKIQGDTEDALKSANARIKEQQTEILNLKQTHAIKTELSKSHHATSLTALTDGQRFSLKRKLGDFKGHSVSITLVGHEPQARILFEQLQDIFKDAGWEISTTQIGQLVVTGASTPTTSFLSGADIAAPIVGSVFAIFSGIGVDLPLVPRAFQQGKAEIVIVVQ